MKRSKAETKTTAARAPSGVARRHDLAFLNETTMFVVTSRAHAGRGLEPGTKAWERAVSAGEVLPFVLAQDDAFVVRLVVNDELAAQESDEWVGRIESQLVVRDGALALCAGPHLVSDGLEDYSDPTEKPVVRGDVTTIASASFGTVHFVSVPAGTYRAELTTHLWGLNGRRCLALAPNADGEDLVAFCRRTRCKDLARLSAKGRPITFVLRLAPLGGKLAKPPRLENACFPIGAGARKPARFPLGLTTTDALPKGSIARNERAKPPLPTVLRRGRDDFQQLLQLADAALNAGDDDVALLHMERAYEIARAPVEAKLRQSQRDRLKVARFCLAVVQSKRNERGAALEHFEAALAAGYPVAEVEKWSALDVIRGEKRFAAAVANAWAARVRKGLSGPPG